MLEWRRLMVVLGLVLALGGAWRLAHRPRVSSPPSRPNLILITVDALRADHLGVYGYQRNTSPALDQFARSAIVVTDGISQAPYTKASIASLLTGLLPSTHKTHSTADVSFRQMMTGTVGGQPLPTADVLPAALPLLPETLRQTGYETFAFTTNPFLIADFGFSRGFNHFRFFSGDTFASADQVLLEAWRAVSAPRSRPFFVWVHLMEPHSGYTPSAAARALLPPVRPPRPIPSSVTVPPYLIEEPSRDLRVIEARYDGEIRTADAALGAFFNRLRASGLWDTTAIVVTADHGEELLDHGGLEHNRTLYDEVIRVPMLIRVPGLPPRRLKAQMQIIDVFPTLVALAGGPPPPDVFGTNMVPVLAGSQSGDLYAVSELVGSAKSLRTLEWKLIENFDGRRELYRLDSDRVEQHNLAESDPTRLAALAGVLHGIDGRAAALGLTVQRDTAPVPLPILDRLRSLGYAASGGGR